MRHRTLPDLPPGPSEGGPWTFEDIYAAHADRVLALVWLLDVRAADCMDVAQEVWIVVDRKLGSYDTDRAAPRVWLAGIVRNTVKTWRRTTRRRPDRLTEGAQAPDGPDPRTPDRAMAEKQRRHALRAFLFEAIPDEDRREAFVLHEYFGQTIAEVAETTNVPEDTVKQRLRMARRDLERAKAAMSDEDREKLRAFVVSFATVDELIEAMRPKVSDDEIAELWDRVSAQIEREGHHRHGDDVAQGKPPAPPRPARFAFTGGQLAAGIAGVFLAGAVTGAIALLALLPRDRPREASIASIDEIQPPAPVVPLEDEPTPLPSARAAPPAPSTVDRDAVEAAALLRRSRAALVDSPLQALALADEHARRFPGRNAAQCERFAIRALLQLGRRTEASARAEHLVKVAPAFRSEMEATFGRPFL